MNYNTNVASNIFLTTTNANNSNKSDENFQNEK